MLTAVSGASHGTVAYDAVGGTVTFTPAANFSGIAGFDYTVSDGRASGTGHVAIDVIASQPVRTPVNDILNSVAQLAALFRAIVNPPIFTGSNGFNGTISYDPIAREVVFTPAVPINAGTGFAYVIDTGNLSIIRSSTPANQPLTMTFSDLTPGGSGATGIAKVFNAFGGVAKFDAATGTVTFTPNPRFSGVGYFHYRLDDGTMGRVLIVVTPPGRADVIAPEYAKRVDMAGEVELQPIDAASAAANPADARVRAVDSAKEIGKEMSKAAARQARPHVWPTAGHALGAIVLPLQLETNLDLAVPRVTAADQADWSDALMLGGIQLATYAGLGVPLGVPLGISLGIAHKRGAATRDAGKARANTDIFTFDLNHGDFDLSAEEADLLPPAHELGHDAFNCGSKDWVWVNDRRD